MPNENENTATLVSITVSGQTTVFNVNDAFVFYGIVTATYDDEHTENVTGEAIISTPDMTTAGEKTVTVTYGGKSTSFTIQVNSVWYVKGDMNDWEVDSRYKLLNADADKPVDAEHQYLITLNLTAGDTFKFYLVGTESYLSYASFEEGGAKSNFENNSSNNINTLVTGEYMFYLKEYNGYRQIFVKKKNISSQAVNTFGVIKLVNNILTIDGTSFKLVGTTTGSDVVNSAYKTISSFIDNSGYINIRIGDAVFKCEDYDTSGNFVLSNNNYLETIDGALFNVVEGSNTFSIISSITNGSTTGATEINPGGTATVTIVPTPNTHRILPNGNDIAVTGAAYTYDSTNGVITLSYPTGNVTITASCPLEKYSIATVVTNGSHTGNTEIEYGGNATITVQADDGYELPSDISVSGASYTYNNETGVIVLSNPTGNITIQVVCTEIPLPQEYTITAYVGSGVYSGALSILAEGTAHGAIIPNSGYTLPDTISVTNATADYNPATGAIVLSNPTGGVLIIATCI